MTFLTVFPEKTILKNSLSQINSFSFLQFFDRSRPQPSKPNLNFILHSILPTTGKYYSTSRGYHQYHLIYSGLNHFLKTQKQKITVSKEQVLVTQPVKSPFDTPVTYIVRCMMRKTPVLNILDTDRISNNSHERNTPNQKNFTTHIPAYSEKSSKHFHFMVNKGES